MNLAIPACCRSLSRDFIMALMSILLAVELMRSDALRSMSLKWSKPSRVAWKIADLSNMFMLKEVVVVYVKLLSATKCNRASSYQMTGKTFTCTWRGCATEANRTRRLCLRENRSVFNIAIFLWNNLSSLYNQLNYHLLGGSLADHPLRASRSDWWLIWLMWSTSTK